MAELTENQKAFKRLLKEIGIYHLWVKNRKEYLHFIKKNVEPSQIISFNLSFYGNFMMFSNAIRYSFDWLSTGIPNLWADLAHTSNNYGSNQDILNDKEKIKTSRDIVFSNGNNTR